MSDEFMTLIHEGILRKSGRYPWGSGENPYQRSMTFSSMVDDLRKQGLTSAEIARGLGLDSSAQLRPMITLANEQIHRAELAQIQKYKEKQMSNVAIAELMGKNESYIRSRLAKANEEKKDSLSGIRDMLKERVTEDSYLDIGLGTENHIGISQTRLNAAVKSLHEDGYQTMKIYVDTSGNNKTTVKVLVPPGVEVKDIYKNTDKIKTIADIYTDDGGNTFHTIKPPVYAKMDRIAVRYAEEGGGNMDGVIQLRRNVPDLDLGAARYAQVRIAVEGDKYLKGMAMYSDDLPPGVDMVFNTNKKRADIGDDKAAAMKSMKVDKKTGNVDEQLPFGSVIRQKNYTDSKGKVQQSLLNIVGTPKPDSDEVTSGEEGGWSKWSKTLSSQMLSKQEPDLARQQLGEAYNRRKEEYDEIMALTNPVVKKKLLEEFASGADSASVHLKAAGLPRTANHVILPINSLKDNEVFAPNYNDGERVVLIRHPHGGTFEIPELTVNNRNREANSVIKQAVDAVGINANVAARLSGADFDGDTVLVIPQSSGGTNRIKTTSPLKDLENFDHQTQYRGYAGMKVMSSREKGLEMGKVSNLITDMTLKGATEDELARAVKHSMVVIDAEKHKLDYKQSEADNRILDLKKKYQTSAGSSSTGASTLISRASSDQRVRQRKEIGIDPKTGKKQYLYSDAEYTIPAHYKDAKTGKRIYLKDLPEGYVPPNVQMTPGSMKNPNGPQKPVLVKEVTKFKPGPTSTKMAETDDARTLLSDNGGTVMEREYAAHANKLKAIANEARKNAFEVVPPKRDPAMAKVYAPEVESLRVKLNTALKNAPRERQARLIADRMVRAKREADPEISDDEVKKLKNVALAEARARTGAKKDMVTFTPREWEAVQSRAVSPNMLADLLKHANVDEVKELAMPRQPTVMVPAVQARAQQMFDRGYTSAEVSSALGIPVSTINTALSRSE